MCTYVYVCVLLDYEKVITHSIQQSNYEEALHVLTSRAQEALTLDVPDRDKKARFTPFASLFYRFSPILVKKCAEKTVDAWIKMGKYLEPQKLIPALIQCNQSPDSKQVRERWRDGVATSYDFSVLIYRILLKLHLDVLKCTWRSKYFNHS